MVHEIRKIIFSSDELFMAFEAFARKTPNFLPPGKLRSCTPANLNADESGSGIKIKIAMNYGDLTNEVEFTYRGVDVVRPLILFCLENNIMLPLEGQKSFSIIDSNAALCIELNLETTDA